MRHLLLSAVLLSVSLTGCGASLGEHCTDSSDCAGVLECVPYGGMTGHAGGATCDENALVCSSSCEVDEDCEPLGEGLSCLNNCGYGSCVRD